MNRRWAEWLEQRTGLVSAIRGVLNEEIPSSSGWPQVFGSVVLFLFLTQAFTGILLALNFAPSPGDAYESLQYILRDVTGGRMIRGLHHWGASMMIVVTVAHMVQVFLFGAYKKPREVTWMLGVVLLLITLGFGLTGYLLPWDDRAYWGTVVTTRIAGEAPMLGRYVQRIMGAENGVGVVTFARFYALHTLILPLLAFTLVGFHVFLVRKHGVTPSPLDSGPKLRFFPRQAFKDVAAIFATFVVLFVLAAIAHAPLEGKADPTNAEFTPRPDWYFLFLFQLLKFFKGAAEPIGSVVLPTLAVLVLIAVPFLDRTRMKRVAERSVAIGIVVFCAIGWASLTAAAVMETPRSSPKTKDWRAMTPKQLAALGYRGSESSQVPAEMIAGAKIFMANNCAKCHTINGEGGKIGPSLNGVSKRHDSAWVAQQFKDPKSHSADSVMPSFEFSDHDRDTLIKYLFSLPDK